MPCISGIPFIDLLFVFIYVIGGALKNEEDINQNFGKKYKTKKCT